MARAEVEQGIQQLERQIQQLERQLTLLRDKLAKEPLSLDTWVCWDVWTQQCTRLTKESFEGVVIDREFRDACHRLFNTGQDRPNFRLRHSI